jgi:hypothetical protein
MGKEQPKRIYKLMYRYYLSTPTGQWDRTEECRFALCESLLEYLHYMFTYDQYTAIDRFIYRGKLKKVNYDERRQVLVMDIIYKDEEYTEYEKHDDISTGYIKGNFFGAYQRTYYNVFEKMEGNTRTMSIATLAKIFDDYMSHCTNSQYEPPTRSAMVGEKGSKLILQCIDPRIIAGNNKEIFKIPNALPYILQDKDKEPIYVECMTKNR